MFNTRDNLKSAQDFIYAWLRGISVKVFGARIYRGKPFAKIVILAEFGIVVDWLCPLGSIVK